MTSATPTLAPEAASEPEPEAPDGPPMGGPDGRPSRRRPRTEHELFPRGGSWLDLLPSHADSSSVFVFACLEYGVLEAWQDIQGVVRLYLPESCGGHLIVAEPGEDAQAIDLTAGDPARGDPDALMRRDGAGWVTLLPGIHRGRSRPRPPRAPRRATGHGEQAETDP